MAHFAEKPDAAKDTGEGEPSLQTPHSFSSLLMRRLPSRGAFPNEALTCASSILRSETARAHGQLLDDFGAILRGNALYIRRFVCDEADTRLYVALKEALVASLERQGGLIDWSRHQILENPSGASPVFDEIIAMLAAYFDLDVYATRLNYYRDGAQWKPQHHDSHAYGGHGVREDFTVGITLGATRSLLFVHEASGYKFEFPQHNGDCFAFTSEVNTTFTHGVPRASGSVGDRFSIIAWGRRRTINERNGGAAGSASQVIVRKDGQELETVEDAIEAAHDLVARRPPERSTSLKTGASNVPARKKKNRLQ